MKTYVYQKKTLHLNRRRRKGNGIHGSGSKASRKDRRYGKVRDGIILINYDRRQNDDSNYSGPERRSEIDRRSNRDRRQ